MYNIMQSNYNIMNEKGVVKYYGYVYGYSFTT